MVMMMAVAVTVMIASTQTGQLVGKSVRKKEIKSDKRSCLGRKHVRE
jgi:hypothetical protein